MPSSSGAGADPGATSGAEGDKGGTQRLPELARRAEQVFNENVARLKAQSEEARSAADEQLEHARTYVVERVQERPFTTTLAVLGAGFLIGLLFAGRRR